MRDLSAADTEQMIGEVLRADLVEQFHRTSEADFAYALSGVGRQRLPQPWFGLAWSSGWSGSGKSCAAWDWSPNPSAARARCSGPTNGSA